MDIIFKPWGPQKEILQSKKRIISAFAGKRCISPLSKVLTLDGPKSFGDIAEGDRLLSWDQTASQFVMSQSSASFPKTKCSGFRVIHERGEFLASEHHLVFCSDRKYRSCLEIYNSFRHAASDQVISFLSHPLTIEGLYQLSSISSDRHLFQKSANLLGHCEYGSRQCGRQLPRDLGGDQFLFPSLFDVLKLLQLFAPKTFEYAGVQDHKKLKHNHRDQAGDHYSSFYVQVLGEIRRGLTADTGLVFDICERFHRLLQPKQQFLQPFGHRQNEGLFDRLSSEIKAFSPCESHILHIEKVSNTWWYDTHVHCTNNYVSGGAIHHNSGKTEVGSIKSILYQEQKPNIQYSRNDPYIGIIVAPTTDLLRRLSLAKFMTYAKPFIKQYNKSTHEIIWHDNSLVYGLSADKPQRLEGIKASWAWCDEVLQMEEQVYLEVRARVADTMGYIVLTGSLGVQYVNPQQHWAYKSLKMSTDPEVECYEWCSEDNPYFPQEELKRLRETLDPRTYRQLFQIDWNTPPKNGVYDQFDDKNVISYVYNPMLPVYVSIDWGFSHNMVCLFIQYDARTDTVYVMSEISQSKLLIEDLYQKIISMPWPIDKYICDIAGNQEREQTGYSNVDWFRKQGIYFQYRTSSIINGIALVRSYVKNGMGFPKLFIDKSCTRLIDGMRRYRYKEVNGIIVNENPLKEQDDEVDALRYFFINELDFEYNVPRSHIRTKY